MPRTTSCQVTRRASNRPIEKENKNVKKKAKVTTSLYLCPVSTALQSPIEYQRKEGGVSVTRPLSSGRPPSATPTPNGHAPQPPADGEQDDQVGLTFLPLLVLLPPVLLPPHPPSSLSPPPSCSSPPPPPPCSSTSSSLLFFFLTSSLLLIFFLLLFLHLVFPPPPLLLSTATPSTSPLFLLFLPLGLNFDPSLRPSSAGAGDGATGLCGRARGRDLGVSR